MCMIERLGGKFASTGSEGFLLSDKNSHCYLVSFEKDDSQEFLCIESSWAAATSEVLRAEFPISQLKPGPVLLF